MKVSLEWLRRYLDISESAEEIERAITFLGFEVEGVEKTGLALLENVVVGEITKSGKHPNADRLGLCEVITKEGGAARTIVCGASNYSEGDRVVVALPGAVLPGGLEIVASTIRGVVSQGMMCSEKELGQGEDHSGIMILGDRPDLGVSVNDVCPGNDVIFDIEVTPNRPDCLSHIGIARELGAFFRMPFAYPELGVAASVEGPVDDRAILREVWVKTPQNCPHYRAYMIRGIRIGPSPEWMQRLLIAVGLRPINNVVDITNFVLFELGQPLHAFDASKIEDERLVIRQALESDTIVTLDERKRTLDPSMMVIADGRRPLVVAGIMGSVDAEVDQNTVDLVLEAAYFNPASIRRTSRRLGLSTDSSYRFERGVDPHGASFAAMRAIDLILEIAGGEACGGPFVEGHPPLVKREITMEPDFVRRFLGFSVEDREIREIFEYLHFEVSERESGQGSRSYLVAIPTFREDLERPADLVEEFLRVYGTERIPTTEVRAPGFLDRDDLLTVLNRRASAYLLGQHFEEFVNYSMRSGDELTRWYSHAAAGALGLANPLSSDQSHLRASLVPGLLDNLRLNRNRGNTTVRLFEVGNVFRERDGKIWELNSVAFIMVQAPLPQTWLRRPPPDYYTAANLVRNLLSVTVLEARSPDVGSRIFKPIEDEDTWQPGHAAGLGDFVDGFEAKVGLINIAMLKRWGIEGSVIAGVVYLRPDFVRRQAPPDQFAPYSAYPSVVKDLALVVDESALAENVRRDIFQAAGEASEGAFAVESVVIFDVYRGEGLPPGKKSITFSIVFRTSDRTLTDDEVNRAFERTQKSIMEASGYMVRS